MQNPSAGVLTKPELVNAEFYTQTCHWAVLHRHTRTYAHMQSTCLHAHTHTHTHTSALFWWSSTGAVISWTSEHQALPWGNGGDADKFRLFKSRLDTECKSTERKTRYIQFLFGTYNTPFVLQQRERNTVHEYKRVLQRTVRKDAATNTNTNMCASVLRCERAVLLLPGRPAGSHQNTTWMCLLAVDGHLCVWFIL